MPDLEMVEGLDCIKHTRSLRTTLLRAYPRGGIEPPLLAMILACSIQRLFRLLLHGAQTQKDRGYHEVSYKRMPKSNDESRMGTL